MLSGEKTKSITDEATENKCGTVLRFPAYHSQLSRNEMATEDVNTLL